jgi:hypothetical protein
MARDRPLGVVWPPYGDYPLPSAEEALQASLRAFPSWFLRIECDRCGKVRMLNEVHVTAGQRNLRLRDLLARARHEGCGGQPAKAELMAGVEGVSSTDWASPDELGVSSRPVRRIVLTSPPGNGAELA